MKSKIILVIIALFILSLAVHYFPVYKRGYSFSPMGGDLTIARNLALTSEFKMESEKNVVLSSVRVKEEGIYSNNGNKLNTYIYGWIFKYFGFKQELPLYISLILWALTGIVLFFLVLKIFNFKTALIFGLIDIFTPVFIQGSLMAGFYEWAVLFFSFGLLFYLWPKKNKASWFYLVLAGLFFGLASLSRNAFILSFFPLIVYDFWQSRSIKRAILFVLPFVVLWGIYLIPGYLTGLSNTYLSSTDTNFGQYGHLFPDPYTYHFEKEEYLKSISGTSNHGFSEYLIKYDQPVSFKNKIIMYLHSIKFYPEEFNKIIVTGGPLIILLLLAGLAYLYRKKKFLIKLFACWGALWYFFLVVLKTNNWDHFIELRFPIVLLVSLGVVWLIDLILKAELKEKTKYILIVVFSLGLLFHFIQSDKWMLHEEYSTSRIDLFYEMAAIINQNHLDKEKDVIAIDIHPTFQGLNYYTDISLIYFNPATIKKLLDQNKLSWAFEQFGVTRIVGFDNNLTEEITRQTGIKGLE